MKPFWEDEYLNKEKSTFGNPSKEVKELVPYLKKDAKILDVGCGDGRHALYLASLGFQVDAFDLSKNAIEKINYLKQKIQGKKVKVLDMCTGSGCIAISIKKLAENVDVTAVDLSPKALKVAIDNAKQLDAKVTFIESDLFENVSGKYDIIVSNPPYISKSDIETLMEEVKNHEPMMALDGDEDGLKFYKKISEKLNEYLSDDGMIFYEIGYDQGKTVHDILKQYNFKDINVYKDLSGNDRVVIARKGEENV